MINYINYKIFEKISISKSIEKMEKNDLKILFVIDKKNKLLGSVTDGDIRRALIKKKSLNSTVYSICNKKPFYFTKNKIKMEKIYKIFGNRLNHIEAIPIVQKKGKKIIKIITRNDLTNKVKKRDDKLKNIPILIIAGGKGTRLNPFSKVLPKPLIPLDEKPIIDHIIETFTKHGAKMFYVSVNYKSAILKAYLNNNIKRKIDFVEEKKPLGTIGSLKLIEGKINKPIIISNCDILTKFDIPKFYTQHLRKKNHLSLVLSKVKHQVPYGVCNLDNKGEFNNFEEKPNYKFLINIGMYIVNPEIIKFLPINKKVDMNDFINLMKKKNKRIGVHFIEDKNWTDIGEWAKYETSQSFLSNK